MKASGPRVFRETEICEDRRGADGLAKEEGIEFADEQLQAIAGGYYTCGEAVC